MGQLELVPASQLDDVELARLFTAAYEGYVVPFAVDDDAHAAVERFIKQYASKPAKAASKA